MRDEEWRGLDEAALERALIERWLYRGAMLGVILLSAIAVTYLGLRGLAGFTDQLTAGVVVAVGLAAGVAAFAMRQQDSRIHQELRRRRRSRPEPPS